MGGFMETTLNDAMDSLWASTITNIDFDLFNKTITIKLTANDYDVTSYYTVSFLNCSGFLWIEKPVNRETDFKEWDYYEVTSISNSRIQFLTNDEYMGANYSIEYNFSIEIWESMLLIYSDTVEINGQHYNVKRE